MNKTRLPKALIAKGDKLFGSTNWNLDEGSEWDDDEYGKQLELFKIAVQDDDDNTYFDDDKVMASIRLVQMPGCCGVVIFTELQANVKNKGYGEFLAEVAVYWAATVGYTLAMATTNTKNGASVAQAVGATEASSFTNRKTHHPIKVWAKKLPKPIRGKY